MAALLVASGSLTWYQFGRFRINAETGYYLAFPLFAYHLFSPGNGPDSARIDHTLRICDPGVDYSQITIETSNKYLWGEFFNCLSTHGWTTDQIESSMTAAYLEGIRARPGTWLYNWLGYSLIELGYPVVYEGESPPGDCPVAVVATCPPPVAAWPPGRRPGSTAPLLRDRFTCCRSSFASPRCSRRPMP